MARVYLRQEIRKSTHHHHYLKLLTFVRQPWYRYFDLTLPEIGELISIPNAGRLVH